MRSRENKTEFYLVNENVEEYIENGAVKYFLLYKRKKNILSSAISRESSRILFYLFQLGCLLFIYF